jgi:hypothetical protein
VIGLPTDPEYSSLKSRSIVDRRGIQVVGTQADPVTIDLKAVFKRRVVLRKEIFFAVVVRAPVEGHGDENSVSDWP